MPNILCTTEFTGEDLVDITAISVLLGISEEEVVRLAVRKFCSVCVPTHSESETVTA